MATQAPANDERAERAQPERPDLFISYAREDVAFAERVESELRARGKDVWIDSERIEKGVAWWDRIEVGIESARAVVAVLSPDFAQSTVCDREIAHALAHNKRLLPVLYRPVEPDDIRQELAAVNWISFTEAERFDAAVEELVQASEIDLAWIDRHARLLVRALEWRRADERTKPSLLLRGSDLDAAETWVAAQGSHAERATSDQVEYIVASRRAATRRQRVALGAVAVALAVALGLAAFAFLQRSAARNEAAIAKSQLLAAESRTKLATDPEAALSLAVGAMKEKTTTQARAALRLAVAAAPDFVIAGGEGSSIAPAFSPDGRFLVTGSRRNPTLWNVAAGRRVATLRTDDLSARIVFSPAGDLAVGVGSDWMSATVWAIPSGKVVKHLEFTDSPANLDAVTPDLVFSPKGDLLAGSTAAATDVWSTRTWKLIRRLPHETLAGERGLAAFSPGGDRLALEQGDFSPAGTLVVRDTRTWDAVDTIPAPKRAKSIDSFAFGPDGTLAIASNDYVTQGSVSTSPVTRLTVRSRAGTLVPRVIQLSGLWSSPTFNADGSLLALFGNADVNGVAHTAVLRTSDWKLVASRAARELDAAWRRGVAVSGDGTTDVVDLATDVRVATLGRISQVALSPRTNAVAAVGADGRVRLWRNVAPAVWGPRGTAPFPRSNFIAGGDFKRDYPYVAVAAFSPDRRTVALDRGVAWADQLELWRATRRRAVFPHLDSFPYDVALSPDGRFATTGGRIEDCTRRPCRTGPLEVWDTRTGDRVAFLRNASVATWSPGGRWMAASPSTGARHVRGVRVYDSRTWDVVAARPMLTGASFTSGGHVVSSSPADTVLWSPIAGTTSAHLTGSPAAVDAPPGGDLIATYDGNRLFVWDGSAAAVSELRVGPHVDAVALGGRLVATQKDARTTVWETKRAHRLASLSGTIADISPDGRFVLTLAPGGEARVWDSEAREIVLDLSRPGLIQHAVFGPNGRSIVAVGSDAVVRTFACAACAGVDDLMRLAAARLRSR